MSGVPRRAIAAFVEATVALAIGATSVKISSWTSAEMNLLNFGEGREVDSGSPLQQLLLDEWQTFQTDDRPRVTAAGSSDFHLAILELSGQISVGSRNGLGLPPQAPR